MKRIVFLIIASLLVLGLVLPGCDGGGNGGFDQYITFGVVGPMDNIQGRDHWAGAEMAADEINDAGGVTIGDTTYGIALEKIDTNEIVDTSGETGITEITKVIDDVDFFVGGFRTEALDVYMDTIMADQKIFIDTGAATNSLCEKVWDDYDTYKYFFRGSPYCSTFLVTSCFKILGSVNAAAKTALSESGNLTLAVLYENAEWALPMLPYIEPTCELLSIDYLGKASVESNAGTVAPALGTIAAMNGAEGPHIVFTILSGPPGKAYGVEQDDYLPGVISTGINVESQDIGYHEWTGAEYHIGLDTWAPNTELSGTTLDWFDDFFADTGRYPTYCAATYDAINGIVTAIKSEGLNTDDIIEYLEDNKLEGVAGTSAYYPYEGAVNLTGFGPGLKCGLSYDQAVALYPHVPAMYGILLGGATPAEVAGNWTSILLGVNLCCSTSSLCGFTNLHGFIPHDLVYGPGWQTGQGVQWQPEDPEDPEGDWAKLGWWPAVALPTGANTPADELTPTEMGTLLGLGLCDKYGNWNMEYEGADDLIIPDAFVDYWTE